MREIKKSARIIYVLEAVTSLGRATPKDVHSTIVQRLQIDAQDSNFLRTVYRDLKELTDSGQLRVQYFDSSGNEVSPDHLDTFKNLRAEYVLAGQDHLEVLGSQLLTEIGSQLLLPKRQMSWKIVKLTSNQQLNQQISFLFKGLRGQICAVQIPRAELPAKILFCRRPENRSEANLIRESIASVHGQRTACLFLADPSVSRFIPGQKFGHGLLSIDHQGQILFEDFASTSGSFWSEANSAEIDEVSRFNSNDKTTSVTEDLLSRERSWQKCTAGGLKLPNTFGLQLGQFKIFVCQR